MTHDQYRVAHEEALCAERTPGKKDDARNTKDKVQELEQRIHCLEKRKTELKELWDSLQDKLPPTRPPRSAIGWVGKFFYNGPSLDARRTPQALGYTLQASLQDGAHSEDGLAPRTGGAVRSAAQCAVEWGQAPLSFVTPARLRKRGKSAPLPHELQYHRGPSEQPIPSPPKRRRTGAGPSRGAGSASAGARRALEAPS